MKRSKIKSVSDDPKKKLKAKIDAVVREYIKLRDDYVCIVCGKKGNYPWRAGDWNAAECGHLFTRSYESTRFDMTPDGNCHCQCHACNMRHGGANCRFKTTVDQSFYFEAYLKKFGKEAFERLKSRAHDKNWRNRTKGELEVLLEESKIALEELKKQKGIQ